VSVTLVILTRNNLVINTKYSILKYKINHFLHLFHENIIICLHYHILSIFRRHFARLSTKQTSSCFSGFLTFDCRFRHFGLFLFNVQFDFPTSCSGHIIYICIMCDLKISFTWLFMQFLFNKKNVFIRLFIKSNLHIRMFLQAKYNFHTLFLRRFSKYPPLQPPFNFGPQCLWNLGPGPTCLEI
jgi:hypothetical protein